ncbi:MAG: hypothetical protein V3U49_02530 [Nitrososphaerales archaeon]
MRCPNPAEPIRYALQVDFEIQKCYTLGRNGREDIGRIATYVDYHADIRVEQIVHSGKTRARQSAEILSDHLKPTKGVNQVDNLEPGADAESRW